MQKSLNDVLKVNFQGQVDGVQQFKKMEFSRVFCTVASLLCDINELIVKYRKEATTNTLTI
jgi:hypothetical protein